MGRATIRKVFVTGLVLLIAGGVIVLLSQRAGQSPNSPADQAGLLLSAFGGLIELISWILALIATAALGRWGWFVVVLVLGLIGLLLPVMIVYSVVGPSRRRENRVASRPSPDEPDATAERRPTVT